MSSSLCASLLLPPAPFLSRGVCVSSHLSGVFVCMHIGCTLLLNSKSPHLRSSERPAFYSLPSISRRGDTTRLPPPCYCRIALRELKAWSRALKGGRVPKGSVVHPPHLYLFLSFLHTTGGSASTRLSVRRRSMKCVLVVHSVDERTQRSCDLPDGVSTQEQLRTFLQSQDLRLESVDFTFTVSLVETKSGVAAKGEKAVRRTDADVLKLLKAAKKQMATHVLTFEVTISASSSSCRRMSSFLSSEYVVDKDLVTLHVFAPLTSPSSGNSPDYQEKMFIIPTRFVLESLTRAVEDTLRAKHTNGGMKLALYMMPQQPNVDQVEIKDDMAALQLLRRHASQRTPVRLTYTILARTPKVSSAHMSRRTSQQQFTAPHSPLPPQRSNEAPNKPTLHIPSLSKLASESSSQSQRGPASQAPSERKGTTSSPWPSREVTSPSSSAPLGSSQPAEASCPSSAKSEHTPHRVFLRESAIPATQYDARVQVRADPSESASAADLLHEMHFVYTKKEAQLWQRFAMECEAAVGAEPATHLLVLSNDLSVRLDTDSVLREWLALAKESQQPLRVRLSRCHPAPPTPVKADAPAARAPELPADDGDTVSAGLDVFTPHAAECDSSPVCSNKLKRNMALSRQSGSAVLSPDTAAAAAFSPLPPHNGSTSSSSRTARRGVLSQERSHASLQDISSSSLQKDSLTKMGSVQSSTRYTAVSPHSPSSTVGTECGKDSRMRTSEEVTVEADAPPLVTRTTAGTSVTDLTDACLSCVCECDSDDTSSVRFQVSARWGAEQRMMLFRLREDTTLHDLRCAVLDAFCGGVTATDDVPSLTMEICYAAAGRKMRLLLENEAQLPYLRRGLLVDSAEVYITAPPTPPPPRSAEKVGGTTDDTAQVAAGVLQLLANSVVQHLGSCPPLSSAEISDLMRTQLGKQAAAEPFSGFLDRAAATPFDVPTPDPDSSVSWGVHVLPWISSVLSGIQAPPSAVTEIAVEVASSLLRSLLYASDFLLDQFAASVRVAADGDAGSDVGSADTTVPLSLAVLWGDAGLETPQSSSRAAWNPFRATYIGCRSGWRAAYEAAPASVLDLIAAGVMDGVWAFPHCRDAQADMVWQRSLTQAHRDCCESINPTELERYLKSGDCSSGEGEVDYRGVILSCVGALLAPLSTPVSDYAEWLTQHFRGKVATVLYANMIDYDARSTLPIFHVTQLSWILLHPQLRRISGSVSSLTTLQRLHVWALLATVRSCQRLNVPFPPCPLLHVHKASPLPFARSAFPEAVAADTPEVNMETLSSMPGVCVQPPCDAAAADTTSAALLRPSPPSAGASPQTAYMEAPRKVQYVCKYNFDALRRLTHRSGNSGG
ncbi:hypothetical protein, conserved [Leishmania tarentolae]|uniref:Uncharacterized protein n=1 Tax=Leishmania tarentolae TaxID=5689 RepID=A0A640KFV1_LEITA|nr:hypothetical protein, conserved [Leishmania tarentolae]